MIRGLNKITKATGLGYLMSSYTSHNSFEEAEGDAKAIAADLLRAGLVVFAPIAYGPGLERLMSGGAFNSHEKYYRSHEFWMPICERFFDRCDYGVIATTPGWHHSTGIAIELAAMTRAGKPVWIYDTGEDEIIDIGEATEKFDVGMEELVQRSIDLGGKYLASSGEVWSKATWLGIQKHSLARADA